MRPRFCDFCFVFPMKRQGSFGVHSSPQIMAKLGLAIAGCSLLIAPSQGLTPPPLSLARRARQAAFPIARRAASLAEPEGLGDLQINAVDSVDWECKPKTAECVMVEKPRARDR